MWFKAALLCPVICLAIAQPTNDEKAKKDLERMQGKWMMHALEINGKDVAPKQIADTFLDVKGDVYRTTVKGKEHTGLRMKLDASKEPRTIDMILTEGGTDTVFKGIYVLEKDEFKMCRAGSAEKERPSQFGTWPDTNYFMVTWKKVAK